MFKFDNPTFVGSEGVADDLGFEFTPPDPKVILEDLLKPEDFVPGDKPGDPISVPNVEEKVPVDTTPNDTPGDKTNVNDNRQEEFNELANLAPAVAQLLADNGFFKELPADVDVENFDQDALIKTVKHNMDIQEQTGFESGVEFERNRMTEGLPQTGLKLLEYLGNPNLDDDDIKNYLKAVVIESDITRLNPSVSADAEGIVRAFYDNDGRFSREEIDEKVGELIQSNNLSKEASRLKPKVDAWASKNAQEQVDIKKQMKDQETAMHGHLVTRTRELLKGGQLNGVPLIKEDAELVYNMMANNEVKVPIKGGKFAEMGLAEALVFQHKYTEKGNLENLMLGLLVMAKGPETVERYFAQKARTTETEKVIKEQRFSFGKKSGVGQESTPDAKIQGGGDFSFIIKK